MRWHVSELCSLAHFLARCLWSREAGAWSLSPEVDYKWGKSRKLALFYPN